MSSSFSGEEANELNPCDAFESGAGECWRAEESEGFDLACRYREKLLVIAELVTVVGGTAS